jgi:hypothetical protein
MLVGVINALQPVRLAVFAPPVDEQPVTAQRGQGKGEPVLGVAVDRLLCETECIGDLPR